MTVAQFSSREEKMKIKVLFKTTEQTFLTHVKVFPIVANKRAQRQALTNEMTHLEGFADEFVMVGQVGPAVDAGVGPVAGGKILAKCLGHLFETNTYEQFKAFDKELVGPSCAPRKLRLAPSCLLDLCSPC